MYRLKQWSRDLFLYPRSTIGSDETYWKSRGRTQSGTLSAWQKERVDWALARMDTTGTFSLLDVGSGDGGVLRYVRDRSPNMRGVGVDRDPEARTALSRFGFTALDIALDSATTYAQLPEADYVFLFEILEHVPDAEGLLAVSRSKARRGVFFSVPNTGFFTHRFRLLLGKFPAQWVERPNEHLRFWTLTDMRWWLGAQGITNAEVHPYEGGPVLKYLFPSLFAAGIIVWIPHV